MCLLSFTCKTSHIVDLDSIIIDSSVTHGEIIMQLLTFPGQMKNTTKFFKHQLNYQYLESQVTMTRTVKEKGKRVAKRM